MGLIDRKRERAAVAVTTETSQRAQKRARRLTDSELLDWLETCAMNMGQTLSAYRHDGDVTALHEAIVINDSMRGMLAEAIERGIRS